MSIVLESDRLSVEIAEPGVVPNTTTRFDRAGMITHVTLDNKYSFCTNEPSTLKSPSTGGVGLCSEFRFADASIEAPVGGRFPKFGVGLLTKDDDSMYSIHHPYECEAFDISYKKSKTSVVFDTMPKVCMGYASRQKKVIELCHNELSMTMAFENAGDRAIAFDEYCHNFLTIDHLPIDERCFLSMPIVSQAGKLPKFGVSIMGKENGFTFRYSDEPSLLDISKEEILPDNPFKWQFTNTSSPAMVSETVSEPPSKVTVWTIDHILSPEVVCHFSVMPGNTVIWNRKWVFSCNHS